MTTNHSVSLHPLLFGHLCCLGFARMRETGTVHGGQEVPFVVTEPVERLQEVMQRPLKVQVAFQGMDEKMHAPFGSSTVK